MLNTNYITIQDFRIVDVAIHCDYTKLNIAIDDALNFDLPENLCQYYKLVIDAFGQENQSLLYGSEFQCGNVTKKFIGLKSMLVYYAYANYLLNSTMTDSGIGFVEKTDSFSVGTPLKEITTFAESYRNRAFSVIKQLKEFVSHDRELCEKYNLPMSSDCGCGSGKCDFTEKRGYKFRPKVIRKRL